MPNYFSRFWYFLLLLLFSYTLLGCGAAESQATATAVSSPTIEQSDAYPGPGAAYPAPEIIDISGVVAAVESESPLQLPDPQEGFATVGGRFINQRTGKAPIESIVYLGDIVYTDTNLPVIRLDRQTAPFAILEEDGEFVFSNVIPGEYAVVFFTPDISFPIDDLETGQTLILNLTLNDKIDLGVVELPIR